MSDGQKLFGEPPTKLKAITINGAIQVESVEDVKNREERRRQRKSRWDQSKSCSSNDSSSSLTGQRLALTGPNQGGIKDNPVALKDQRMSMPTAIDASKMDDNQQKIYLLQMQIQDATKCLGRPDLGIPADPRDRSPSPEPIYNNAGVRINCRTDRVRHRLVQQRNAAITRLKDLDPTYQPPSNFKYKNAQLEDKVILPADEHPQINFVGLLLGPRGHFLEKLKEDTKCSIIIRGKGSLRSGMTGIARDGRKFDALDEPLHAFIQGPTAEDVQGAVKKIQELINMQIYNPDCEQAVALRARHMHELAILNGTVKEIDMKCLNCGKPGHKSWQCDERPNFTSAVICNACGGVGHLTTDCQQRRPGTIFTAPKADPVQMDSEYEAFLNDMGHRKGEKVVEKPYVPPMGDLSQCLKKPSAPLMLTNGSAAAGAASAHSRAISNPQTAGGLRVIGTSIFGGKLTQMTSGFKSMSEVEREKEKKKLEFQNRPVPLEWQVERFEKSVNRQQEQYMQQLEQYRAQEKSKLQEQSNIKQHLSLPPPPPPPAPPKPSPLYSRFVKATDTAHPSDCLPNLNGNPFDSLKKKA